MSLLIREAQDEAFKRALGSFASGVTVITVLDAHGRPAGMTANAFTSVSMEPLLILVCLNRDSRTYEDVSASGRFGVNILDNSGVDISNYCARAGEDKCLPEQWLHTTQHDHHAPVLAGAIAYLDCRVNSEVEAGTHAVVLGEVTAIGITENGDSAPLVYFRGQYRELQAPERVSA